MHRWAKKIHCYWINEYLPLDSNEVTDEELSEDEDTNIIAGDKLYKLGPLIKHCNKVFASYYHGTRELSIDESMIIFKGRNSMKQYNPLKLIKRGYKSFGLGERVVLHLTKDECNKNIKTFFDNYFTSLPLIEKLKAENSLACGTIRSNRKDVPVLDEDSKAPRGSSDYRITNSGIYKWKDTKYVMLASNYHGSELTTVTRKDKFGRKKDMQCPQVVRDYNCYMGGVDHADQLRMTYGVDRKSKKWWHRIFWGLLDIMFAISSVSFLAEVETNKGIA
ncbi:piggyBac transposable element-derived protein 3-like [Adelges cooleyi]|uniref:piggyBac transposable element-derived protein 3-like n=1 Tax=Adelges cooleyi TaxID=133065 RepID=UPI00217FD2C0|nr:piggyBac transposable element-derived protein 3-like [Adelges cooleyi]